MDIGTLLPLFLALIALAALPSTSVALVVVRSAESGIGQGLAAAVGITLADLLLAALALAGWQAVMESLGIMFNILRWLAAAYLIWFGWSLWSGCKGKTVLPASQGSWFSSLLAGLLLTLGDIKALVFYASFFPLFITAPLSPLVCLQLLITTAVALLLVKSLYALFGSRLTKHHHSRPLRRLGGGLIIGCGLWLASR
ncbi:transporter [Halopseudomonas oceani]|uniref:LysE family translocator n=1 Tax=Halopseudomonas oceani TaxID=1708783 RepID=A0A2P4EXL8_9GAMM|nr:LysE family transporter [Halopseudomonas oceani]POB04972.1 LysE family translocator [Halopseudomonas oceani]GGE32057.1 transporter [Halopseudomonas oceani]